MDVPANSALAELVAVHVSEGIVLTDPHGDVVWVNPAFERLSGYTLDELRGHRPADLLQGDATQAASRRALAEAIANRTGCTTDIINYHRDGTPYVVEISLSPIFDANGTLTHFVAVERDVTAQRRLEAENVDLQAYRRALDAHAIISVTDPRGRITFVNDNFCRISGYTRAELVGSTHRIVNSALHDRTFFRQMWQTIRTGGSWNGEICNRAKDGTLYWVDTTIVPVRDQAGEILRYVSTRYDITERKQAEQELRRMAETDPLTGLANRATFALEVRRRLAACLADPGDTGGLVLSIDLDHFQDINDSRGHHVGDLLLKQIAQRLGAIPGAATAARLGGDEFALILPDTVPPIPDPERVQALRETLSQAIQLDDMVHVPSVSIGVARYPQDADTSDALIIGADIALYEAKREGRNRSCFFDPNVRARLDYRTTVKAALHQAIEEDLFEVVLQPIVAVADGRHLGFEVLTRLSHEGKALPPDHFVPLAEELGLIGAVSRLVMRRAALAWNDLRRAGGAPGFMGINVAAPQFRDPGFVAEVQEFLFEHGLDPRDVLVEITETALIGRSTDVVAQTLVALRQMGLRVALDDFGTGFSSLSHLRDFAVDKIKIDRSFVQGLHRNPRDRDLVEGLVSLAHRIGIEIVAEGVEEPAQLEFLREVGVQQAQGYLFARPMPVSAAFDWLGCGPRDAALPVAS